MTRCPRIGGAVHHPSRASTRRWTQAGIFEIIAGDPVLSRGYTYSGGDTPNLVYGAFYSTTCRDQLPFVDVAALTELTAEVPWYYDAYVATPYTEICAIWDVGVAPDDPHRPITSDVPILAFAGRFDPHGTPDAVEAGMSGHVPGVDHRGPLSGATRSLPTDHCPLAIRNAWIQDVTAPPDLSCVDGDGFDHVRDRLKSRGRAWDLAGIATDRGLATTDSWQDPKEKAHSPFSSGRPLLFAPRLRGRQDSG